MTKVIIIAEAGVNHNGNEEMAFELVRKAKECGADYVKFQTFITEKIISTKAPKAEYQIQNDGAEDSQFQMVKKLELSFDAFRRIESYCKELQIGFLSTAFDFESLEFIDSLNPDYLKIPSGEITNTPLLQAIASKNRPVILSTGMCTLPEIQYAVDTLFKAELQPEQLTILHCTTEYPTPLNEVNLKAMLHLQQVFGVKIGYSDHTIGATVPFAAVALGATMIEKHFTLDRQLPGPDHIASMEPYDLAEMVKSIREIEVAIAGSGIKEPTPSELKNRVVARKSIHIAHNLEEGHALQFDDLEFTRPGDGISPIEIEKVLGKKHE
jgi:N-acetylneuraminate synthase/N,N'-diacetyllegionaminate synthase